MELNEYLNSSKLKRSNLVKQASKYLQKMVDGDISNELDDDAFKGPNPLRLKDFENKVNLQLQSLYKNGNSTPESVKTNLIKNISINERIRRVYSKKSNASKKKQVMMIPQKRNFSNIKTLAPLKEYMNNSPYLMMTKKISRYDISEGSFSFPTIYPQHSKKHLMIETKQLHK